jgi:hypothetical protein
MWYLGRMMKNMELIEGSMVPVICAEDESSGFLSGMQIALRRDECNAKNNCRD